MVDDARRAELIASGEAFMARYHDAFQHGTRADLEALVHLPVIYVAEDDVKVCDRYPFDPEKLRAHAGFHHADTETRYLHVEPTRMHLVIEGIRRREDGSKIESIDSVYILQDRGDGWKVAVFSGIRGAR